MENIKLVHVRPAKLLLVMCKDETSDFNDSRCNHSNPHSETQQKKKGFISPEYFRQNIMIDVLAFRNILDF
jgi:hypothetical protein